MLLHLSDIFFLQMIRQFVFNNDIFLSRILIYIYEVQKVRNIENVSLVGVKLIYEKNTHYSILISSNENSLDKSFFHYMCRSIKKIYRAICSDVVLS